MIDTVPVECGTPGCEKLVWQTMPGKWIHVSYVLHRTGQKGYIKTADECTNFTLESPAVACPPRHENLSTSHEWVPEDGEWFKDMSFGNECSEQYWPHSCWREAGHTGYHIACQWRDSEHGDGFEVLARWYTNDVVVETEVPA